MIKRTIVGLLNRTVFLLQKMNVSIGVYGRNLIDVEILFHEYQILYRFK